MLSQRNYGTKLVQLIKQPQNKTKQNKTKQNKTKQNKTKQNKTKTKTKTKRKQNKKQNKTKQSKQSKAKHNKTATATKIPFQTSWHYTFFHFAKTVTWPRFEISLSQKNHLMKFGLRGGSMVKSPKILVCYQRWDISIIKNCKVLALECFLFEVKRTLVPKLRSIKVREFQKVGCISL